MLFRSPFCPTRSARYRLPDDRLSAACPAAGTPTPAPEHPEVSRQPVRGSYRVGYNPCSCKSSHLPGGQPAAVGKSPDSTARRTSSWTKAKRSCDMISPAFLCDTFIIHACLAANKKGCHLLLFSANLIFVKESAGRIDYDETRRSNGG